MSLSGGAVITIEDPRIREASGLARSPRHQGVLYTHNDKGTASTVYAVDSSGTRAVLMLNEASALDWEDIASTPDGQLWVGDIGDAEGVRPSISVHVVEEPEILSSGTLASTTYQVRYPDGQHNAEALLVHPSTHRVYIVTKDEQGGMVYRAPARLTPGEVNTLRPVMEAPPNVSAGDFSPDGRSLVLRSQSYAYFYPTLDGQPITERMPEQPQGEAITFDQAGTYVLLGSEGDDSKILRAPVPDDLVD